MHWKKEDGQQPSARKTPFVASNQAGKNDGINTSANVTRPTPLGLVIEQFRSVLAKSEASTLLALSGQSSMLPVGVSTTVPEDPVLAVVKKLLGETDVVTSVRLGVVRSSNKVEHIEKKELWLRQPATVIVA